MKELTTPVVATLDVSGTKVRVHEATLGLIAAAGEIGRDGEGQAARLMDLVAAAIEVDGDKAAFVSGLTLGDARRIIDATRGSPPDAPDFQ